MARDVSEYFSFDTKYQRILTVGAAIISLDLNNLSFLTAGIFPYGIKWHLALEVINRNRYIIGNWAFYFVLSAEIL